MFSFKIVEIIFVTILFASWCEAKVYTKCEFAKAMQKQGVTSHAALGACTCIAYNESKFDSQSVYSRTGDYGILQISHYFWCSDDNTSGKGCNITCKSLLSDDITESITCAKHIYTVTEKENKNGFNAWATYKPYCTGDQVQWISGCELNKAF